MAQFRRQRQTSQFPFARMESAADRKAPISWASKSEKRSQPLDFRCYTAVVMRTVVFVEVKTTVLIQS